LFRPSFFLCTVPPPSRKFLCPSLSRLRFPEPFNWLGIFHKGRPSSRTRLAVFFWHPFLFELIGWYRTCLGETQPRSSTGSAFFELPLTSPQSTLPPAYSTPLVWLPSPRWTLKVQGVPQHPSCFLLLQVVLGVATIYSVHVLLFGGVPAMVRLPPFPCRHLRSTSFSGALSPPSRTMPFSEDQPVGSALFPC